MIVEKEAYAKRKNANGVTYLSPALCHAVGVWRVSRCLFLQLYRPVGAEKSANILA